VTTTNDCVNPEVPGVETTAEQKQMQEVLIAYFALMSAVDDKMSKKQIWKRFYGIITDKGIRAKVKGMVLSMPPSRLLQETVSEYSVRLNIQRSLREAMIP
jgi:hypothetical protein